MKKILKIILIIIINAFMMNSVAFAIQEQDKTTLSAELLINFSQFKESFSHRLETGLERKLAKIKEVYEEITDWGIYEGVALKKFTYDEQWNKVGLVWFSDIDDVNKILDVLPISSQTKICDLGSAIGHICAVFAARGAKVVGYEIDEPMVDYANQILSKELKEIIDSDNVVMERANFLKKDLSEFDVLFHYWHGVMQEYEQEFKEKLVRELKPGGFLVVYMGGNDKNHFPELIEADFLPGYEKIRNFAKIYYKPKNSKIHEQFLKKIDNDQLYKILVDLGFKYADKISEDFELPIFNDQGRLTSVIVVDDGEYAFLVREKIESMDGINKENRKIQISEVNPFVDNGGKEISGMGYCRYTVEKDKKSARFGPSNSQAINVQMKDVGLGSAVFAMLIDNMINEGTQLFEVFDPTSLAKSFYARLGFKPRYKDDEKYIFIDLQSEPVLNADGSGSWRLEDVSKFRKFNYYKIEDVSDEISDQETSDSEQEGIYANAAKNGWLATDKATYSSAYPHFREWLVKKIGTNQRVLSIGCGRGELEIDLQNIGNEVVVIDKMPEMIAAVQKRGIKNAFIVNAHDLPEEFKQSDFDIVIFSESIGNMDAKIVLEQAVQALKPDGRFIITNPAPGRDKEADEKTRHLYRKDSLDVLVETVNNSGLEVVEAKESFWLSQSMMVTLPGHVIYIQAKHHDVYALKNRVLNNILIKRYEAVLSKEELWGSSVTEKIKIFLNENAGFINKCIMRIEEKGEEYIKRRGAQKLEEFNKDPSNEKFDKVNSWTEFVSLDSMGYYDLSQLLSSSIMTAMSGYFMLYESTGYKEESFKEQFLLYFEQFWCVLRSIEIEAGEIEGKGIDESVQMSNLEFLKQAI